LSSVLADSFASRAIDGEAKIARIKLRFPAVPGIENIAMSRSIAFRDSSDINVNSAAVQFVGADGCCLRTQTSQMSHLSVTVLPVFFQQPKRLWVIARG